MRSRLEADYAAELDRLAYRWEHEPECFASDKGQWLPDFGCTYANDGPFGIFDEVKPADPLFQHEPGSPEFIEHVDTVLRRMTIAWASRPDACLRLTFWVYGGPAALSVFSVKEGAPWLAVSAGQLVELLWLGMGQYERARKPKNGVSCSIKPGHWWCSCGCDIQGDYIGPDDVCAHLRALGNSPHGDATRLRERWPGIMGPAAVHTSPGELEDGVFTIYADSADWTERLQSQRMVQAMSVVLDTEITRINVRVR